MFYRSYSNIQLYILETLFLATGWLIIGIHKISTQCVNSCTVNTFKQFSAQSEPESSYHRLW